MTDLSIASVIGINSVKEAGDPLKTIAFICCVGLMTSICLMTMGVDFGTAWMV